MIRKVPSTNWFDEEASPPPSEGDAVVVVEVTADIVVEPGEAPIIKPKPRSRRHRVVEAEPVEVATIERRSRPRRHPAAEVDAAEVVAIEPDKRPRRRAERPTAVAAPPPVSPTRPSVERPRNRTRSRMPWRRIASIAIFAVTIGFWVVALRPTWMGGSASVLTVRGQSMEPTYAYGDIVIAHARSTYSVGDIIAFRVPEGAIGAGTVVIHRIIGGDAATGFVTQGDNNSDPDEWHPVTADILGSATWRIPMVGRLLSVLRSVPGIAAVSGIIAAILVVLGTGNPEPRKRRRPERGAPDDDSVPAAAVPTPWSPAGSSTDLARAAIPPPPIVAPAPIDDPDHEVVGEYWGDLEHLAAILRERSRPNALFDDDLDEVARPLV